MNPVTVTAVSGADNSKSASASVTITAPMVTAPPISVTVSPSTTQVVTLHTQQFTATVNNSSNQGLTWSVNGSAGGSSSAGTISSSGLYTAPQFAPASPVTITATSIADTTRSGSAQVTVLAPPVPTGKWSYLGPNGATDQVQIVPDPANAQTMYLAPLHGGIYKTTDAGNSWTNLLKTTGFPFSLIVGPASGTLYAFAAQGFQVSTDGGKTFSPVVTYPNGIDTETVGVTFAVDPKDDRTVYLLTGTSLLRSRDSGTTWTGLTAPPNPSVGNGLASPQLGKLVVSANTLQVASANGCAVSKDGGTTWQVQNTGLNPSFAHLVTIAQDPNNSSRLIGLGDAASSSANAYVYLSLDGGGSWSFVTTVGVYDPLPQSQTGPGIYVMYGGSIYVTFNNGITLTNISPAIDPTGFVAAVSPVSTLVMAYEGLNDIFVSQDGGATWVVAESGVNGYLLGDIVSAGVSSPLYVSTLLPAGNPAAPSADIWRTSDPSQPWTRVANARSNVPIGHFDVDPANPLHLLAVETEGTNPTSVTSTDGGVTWTPIAYAAGMSSGFQPYNYSSVRFGAPGSNYAFGCGTFGVARLSTLSSIWAIVDNGIPSGATCTAIGVDRATPGTIYASTSSGTFKSIDSGNNWSLLLPDYGHASILVDPAHSNNIFLSSSIAGAFPSKRSTDGGKTWSTIPAEGVMAFNPTDTTIMWAADQNALSVSHDSGLTWGAISSPVAFLADLAVLPSGVVVISTFGSSVVQFTPQ